MAENNLTGWAPAKISEPFFDVGLGGILDKIERRNLINADNHAISQFRRVQKVAEFKNSWSNIKHFCHSFLPF